MATILPQYDWTSASAHITNARSRAYPWEEWLDGQIRKLDKGDDFDGPAMSVERVIRTSANRRGIRVRIRVEGDSIYLQAHTDDARTPRGVTKSATKRAVKEAAVAKAEGRGNGVAPSDIVKPKIVKGSGSRHPVRTSTPSPETAAAKPVTKGRVRKVAAEPATTADFNKAKTASKRTVAEAPVEAAPVVDAKPETAEAKVRRSRKLSTVPESTNGKTPDLGDVVKTVARKARKLVSA